MCCSYLSFLLGPNENKKRLKMFLFAVLRLLDLINFDTLTIVKVPVQNIYLEVVSPLVCSSTPERYGCCHQCHAYL